MFWGERARDADWGGELVEAERWSRVMRDGSMY